MGAEIDAEQLDALQKWQQAHETLPPNIDRRLLARYLHASRSDLRQAQKLLEFGFHMRNAHPEIFLRRDPCSKAARQVLGMADIMSMPSPTPDRRNVMLLRFSDPQPDLLHFNEAVKMFFMVSDMRLLAGKPNDGEVPIFDMEGLSLMHFPRLVLSTLRLYMRYTQEAHPALVKQVHVINCSAFLDRCLSIVRPLIRSEVFKTIHFHAPGSDTLEKFVPRAVLPTEYGGQAGSLAEIRQACADSLQQHREYLMDMSRWQLKTTPSAKEPMRQNAELVGNFRTLCID